MYKFPHFRKEEDFEPNRNELPSFLSSTSIILTPPIENNTENEKSLLSNPSLTSIDSMMSSSMNFHDSNNNLIMPNDFYFNKQNCSSPMYRSITSITSEEDPWRASSIGRCFLSIFEK